MACITAQPPAGVSWDSCGQCTRLTVGPNCHRRHTGLTTQVLLCCLLKRKESTVLSLGIDPLTAIAAIAAAGADARGHYPSSSSHYTRGFKRTASASVASGRGSGGRRAVVQARRPPPGGSRGHPRLLRGHYRRGGRYVRPLRVKKYGARRSFYSRRRRRLFYK